MWLWKGFSVLAWAKLGLNFIYLFKFPEVI